MQRTTLCCGPEDQTGGAVVVLRVVLDDHPAADGRLNLLAVDATRDPLLGIVQRVPVAPLGNCLRDARHLGLEISSHAFRVLTALSHAASRRLEDWIAVAR